METQAQALIRSLPDGPALPAFAVNLLAWLQEELEAPGPFTDSRARALLRASGTVDGPALADFSRLMQQPGAIRSALYDLLRQSGLEEEAGVVALAQSPPPGDPQPPPWLVLALAAFAWQRQYPLAALDPAAPPSRRSPAGQVVANAGRWLRRQGQRGATERERLARRLAYQAPAGSPGPLPGGQGVPVVPHPAIFRPPVPVNYPETVRLEVDQETGVPASPLPGDPLTITESDLAAEPAPSPPAPLPPSAVIMPNSDVAARPSLSVQVRQRLARAPAQMTRLRILVQQYPDGPGFYGVQVRVSCRRIKANVAGTTNRQGQFLCQLPVRQAEGLTYDVAVTWPRDAGGEMERKSITVNSDRTEFQLPFYRQHAPPQGGSRQLS